MSEHHTSPSGYEKMDVNVKKVGIFIIVPSILIIICLIGLDQYMTFSNESMYYDQVLNVEDQTYKELVQKENQTLNNYKLKDKNNDVVQIPISRAMELVVQEGQKNYLK